ncbi:response regulator, partial [Saccharopolyspora sp. HNM0983]
FAAEVTRVAREVGTEGKLGGQAEVADVSGTWRRLTESVNRLAGNLTTQVRAIAGVATAVAEGDLTRRIDVAASGEVAELKDDINAMIGHLRASTEANREQDWLKSNLARISAALQECHDLGELAQLITTELTPLVSAQYGGFYLRSTDTDGGVVLERTSSYGRAPQDGPPPRFRLGESLVGQAAADGRTIRVTDAPPGHVRIGTGLGQSVPGSVVVLPVSFEDEVQAVLELASVHEFTPVHLDLLERLSGSIGVDINTIRVNSRTAALLGDSQRLAAELRTRSEQLQHQQDELRRSNAELEDKAEQLAGRNRDIELKNQEIEQARQQLEQRAQELASASAYKSEFLANMSHELRTPLNSVLILAKLLSDNAAGNLTEEQVDLAGTIHQAGGDLLQMINDVLDLSKVEAGRMFLLPEDVAPSEIAAGVRAMYEPVAADRGLGFEVRVEPGAPEVLRTDRNRLDQILRNLVSNAVRFTEQGSVLLRIRPAEPGETPAGAEQAEPAVAFEVSDSGIGIAPDQLDAVFEAFRQADGTAVRNYGGTGLGLSISKELTTLLHGELAVRSEPGQGSTFTLYLPGQPPEQEEGVEVSGPEIAAQPSAEARFSGQLVLLIDDDARGRHALAAALQQRGLRIAEADGASAGIRVLREGSEVDAVLMDVMMPGMDGNSAIELIREVPRFRNLPVIAVTAQALPDDRERSLAAGATEAISKPVDVAELAGVLAAVLPR